MYLRAYVGSMASDKPRINILVSEEQKSEWKEFAENNGYGTLTRLITQSVTNEMKRSQRETEASQTAAEAGPSEEVLSRLSGLESTLTDVQEAVTAIEGQTGGSGRAYDLKKALNIALPNPPESALVPAGEDGSRSTVDPEHGNVPEWAYTPRDVAKRLGADTDDVEEALTGLQRGTAQVKSAEIDGDTYYWRRE